MFIFVEVSIDVPLNFYDASDYNPIRLLSMRYCMILIQDLHNIKPSILLLTQMSIQQLLALCFKLSERKIFELFNAAHFQWIGTYISWYINY
jgi:hypothetical protein